MVTLPLIAKAFRSFYSQAVLNLEVNDQVTFQKTSILTGKGSCGRNHNTGTASCWQEWDLSCACSERFQLKPNSQIMLCIQSLHFPFLSASLLEGINMTKCGKSSLLNGPFPLWQYLRCSPGYLFQLKPVKHSAEECAFAFRQVHCLITYPIYFLKERF